MSSSSSDASITIAVEKVAPDFFAKPGGNSVLVLTTSPSATYHVKDLSVPFDRSKEHHWIRVFTDNVLLWDAQSLKVRPRRDKASYRLEEHGKTPGRRNDDSGADLAPGDFVVSSFGLHKGQPGVVVKSYEDFVSVQYRGGSVRVWEKSDYCAKGELKLLDMTKDNSVPLYTQIAARLARLRSMDLALLPEDQLLILKEALSKLTVDPQ